MEMGKKYDGTKESLEDKSHKPIGVATYKIHDSLPEQMKDLLPSPEEIKKRLEGLDNEN